MVMRFEYIHIGTVYHYLNKKKQNPKDKTMIKTHYKDQNDLFCGIS